MSGGAEGRGSLPDSALEMGVQIDGVCGSLGAVGRSVWRGPLSWQQHAACLPAVAAVGASARGRAGAQCLSQNLIRCQKPFVCDVWLPKPVVPGLEAGGEQGGCRELAVPLGAGTSPSSPCQASCLPGMWEV